QLGGTRSGGDPARAVGACRHGGEDLVAVGIEDLCARRSGAAVERLGTIGSRGIGRGITEELLVVLVAVFETAGDREGARQARDLPWVAQIDVESRFALHELADIEVFRR